MTFPFWTGKTDISRAIGSSGPYTVDSKLSFFHKKFRVSVLPGFRTDGVSKSWPLFFIDRFFMSIAPAAITHDALYTAQWTSKSFADYVLLVAAISCLDLEDMEKDHPFWKKVSFLWNRIQAFFVFLAVFFGGWLAWRNKTSEDLVFGRSHVEFFRW